jgi:hypothetical protein
MNSGIEQKSRTGIPILDNILNNAGGMNIYNSGADEGWGSNGRYTETKKQLESIDIKWLMVSRFAGKSYKHYQQYKPTTVKPPKSNDPEEEGKGLKEAQSFIDLFKPISIALEEVIRDAEAIQHLEKDLVAAQQGIDTV